MIDGERATAAWRHPLIGLAGGLLVALAMPPWGFWPLAFVGIAVFDWAVLGTTTRRRRALVGLAFGVGWMYPAMAWMWFLTAPGYLVAALLFAGYHCAAAAAAPTGRWGVVGRPAAHALAEAVRFSFPFGGIPLASLGIAQAGSPLLGLARVGGVMLITWVVLQIGVIFTAGTRPLIDAIGRTSRSWGELARRGRPELAAVGAIVVVVALAAVAPRGHDLDIEPMTIAAVQGGGEQGTRALDVPSSIVTARHADATGTIPPHDDLDLVVWPENAIDVDREPFTESPEYDIITGQAARLGVPFSVGVTIDSEYSAHPRPDSFVNAQAIVQPDGRVTSWYEKVRIVPFGEYVPFRGMLAALGAPLENVASDAVQGRDPAVLEIAHGGIDARLGVMISWEVFFGSRGRAADDSHILLNPTNGASYTWTILQTQQVASSKLRAAETGRWVVQVAPTGFSAFVSPAGDVIDRTSIGEQRVITAAIPLRAGTTWYSRWGDGPWWVALTLVFAATWWAGRRAAI